MYFSRLKRVAMPGSVRFVHGIEDGNMTTNSSHYLS